MLMFLLANDFFSKIVIPPFVENIVLPAVVGGVIILYMLNRILGDFGYKIF
jgi:hypothetical protein